MSRSPAKKRLEWSEIAVLAVLGGLVVFGFAANGLSLVRSVVSLGFVAGVLLVAWLWRLSVRRAETAPRSTWRRTAWDAALLFGWVAAMAALAWWLYASDRSDRTGQDASPSEGPQRGAAPFKKLPSCREDGAN